MNLSMAEQRVLGALIEKEITTPEYYPLSLNALTAACNQKSSREPVMTLAEDDIRMALHSLQDAELVTVDHAGRVPRFEHRARTVFHLRRDETALLALLLLRGPQTPGELRSRSDRMFQFDDADAVAAALARMCSASEQRPAPIANLLPRQPGTKEQRYAHALGAVADHAPPLPQNADPLADRVRVLEQQMQDLRQQVDRLLRGEA